MVLGKLPAPGRPTNLDNSRARAYCTCSSCECGCLDIFSLIHYFSSLSLSLVDDPIKTAILSQRAVNPKQVSTN